MSGKLKLRRSVSALTLAACLTGGVALVRGDGVALAQDAGGVLLSFGISSNFEVDDNYKLAKNPPGDTSMWDTRFTFGLLSQTQISSLRLNFGITGRVSDLPDASVDSDFDSPRVSLGYNRATSSSRIGVNASYERADGDFLDPFEDFEVDDSDINFDSGTRITSSIGLNYEIGMDSPLGFAFSGRSNVRDYEDTNDPSLYYRRTDQYSVTASAQFNPVTRGNLTYSGRYYTADDTKDTNKTTESLKFGLRRELDAATSISASLGVSEYTTKQGLGSDRVTTEDDSLVGSLGYQRTLTDGIATADYNRSQDTGISRDTLRFGRSYDRQAGNLAWNLGVTSDDSGNADLVGRLSVSRAFSDSQLTAVLDRNVTSNSSDDEVLRTRIGLSYRKTINQVSSASLGVDYAQFDYENDSSKATGTLRAAYNHELPADWQVSTGYRYRWKENDPGYSADSNSLFLTLNKTFQVRP